MKFGKYFIVNPKKLDLSPKRIFRFKKDPSTVSRSDGSSLSYGSASSSNSYPNKSGGERTPRSVLPGDGPSDPYAELLFAIKKIDKDNDGMLSKREVESFLSKIGFLGDAGITIREIEDSDTSMISVEELAARLGSAADAPADAEELRGAFSLFDADGDGRITAEELLNVFLSLGDDGCSLEDCRSMVAAVGRKDCGFVCFEDFSRMMMR